MNQEYQRIIDKFKNHLMETVNLTQLRPLLVKQKIFNESESDDKFYNFLCSRHPYSFLKFIDILSQNGYINEATLLKDECSKGRTPHIYKMSSKPVRLCLIINNINFRISRTRLESQLDVEALENLFNSLCYKVKVQKDLTGRQMINCIEDFSRNPDLEEVDSIIVYILTHGDRSKELNVDILRGTDEEEVVLKNVYKMFNHVNCPMLFGKPKIFFFQACRGGKGDLGFFKESLLTDIDNTFLGTKSPEISVVQHPSITDTIVIHSTMPCQVSITDEHIGSWLCQEVVHVFTIDHSRHDLDTMLKTVCKRMEDRTSEYKWKQTVHIELFGVSGIVKFGQSSKREVPSQGSLEPVANPAKRQRLN